MPIGVPVGADIAATLAISDALSEDLDTVSDGSISLQLAIGAVRAVSNVESGSAARSTSMAHDAPASRRLRAVVANGKRPVLPVDPEGRRIIEPNAAFRALDANPNVVIPRFAPPRLAFHLKPVSKDYIS